jgi:hypothetical protein
MFYHGWTTVQNSRGKFSVGERSVYREGAPRLGVGQGDLGILSHHSRLF